MKAIPSFLTAMMILLGLTGSVKQGYSAAFGNESDYLALLSFKAMITDDPYNILSSWNSSLQFCEWQGVTCGHRHQRVTALDLQSRRLVGPISPSIVNLTFLIWISLGDNGFHGEIPSDFGLLFRLRFVNLSYNSLEFEIPENLTRLSNLQQLDLSYNKLVGGVPAQLSSCQNLIFVDLSINNLTENTPPLGNLTSLETLNLRENKLSGSIPHDLGRLVQLRKLLLEVNALSGTVPSSIYNISSLLILGLSENELHGGLPPDLGIKLPLLQAIDAGGTSLTGPLPPTLVNASLFFWLDCTQSNFTGQLPSNLGSLPRLTHFSVGSNNLESPDMDFLTSLTNCSILRYLILDNNNFRGHFPESVSNLSTKLTIFGLAFNEISGFIPSGISKLSSLSNFALADNLFTGGIPSTIGMLQNLQLLDLESNKLQGPIPSSIGNLSSLYSLILFNNSLSGSIPWSLGDSKSLQILNLAENNLSGEIPKHLPVNLRYLNLSYNSFSSPLPSEVQNMVSLNTLDVSQNQIDGEIPSTISNCVQLVYLILAGNNFKGTIPSSFRYLKETVWIDLSSNQFNGSIPDFLALLPSLEFLNLSFNNFEGDVPKNGLFANTSAFFVLGNSNLCGGVSQLKLPPCPVKDSGKRKKSSTLLAVLITSSIVVCLILVLSVTALCYTRKSRKRTLPAAAASSNDGYLLKLTYEEIHRATDGFSEANLIGSGSYGSVYKGNLRDEETTVAVKVLNLQNQSAFKTFAAECAALRMIRHRNVVKILTCCSSVDCKGDSFLALVLEFMSQGSLEEWLRQRKLNVLERLNIASDVASALDYLHNHCQNPIVHCDLKPSNILLDDNMTARVSDFGLARILTSRIYETSSINVKGTVGYAPPEYGLAGKASTKGDVYSYGIILLELFTGKRPTDKIFSDDCDLHNFVKVALPERVMEILDPSLLSSSEDNEADINKGMMVECLSSILRIGINCSSKSPRERLDINVVTKELQRIRTRIF